MFRSRRPALEEAWEGIVVDTSRANPDGSNLYHYLKVKLSDGTTRKIRVDGDLWESVSGGDAIVKRAGHPPARG
jgi:hypothetical protein